MTDVQPIQDGSEDLNRDEPGRGEDSLQEQARREAEKAEGDEPDEGRERPSTTPPIANPD
ncbi:hypothetical protein [Brevundimonas sp.]|uniref:hypothetical protein n=1 Tax=Brevundimonas sp. TaxID=1871086 RepID=UPI0028ACE28A|nr:hypothetical protein [Brevundimonas sp.]